MYLFLTLGILISCSKEEQVSNVAKNTAHSRNNQADVVYFYKDKSYPLYFEQGSTEEFVVDENLDALNQITEGKPLASFEFSYQPENHQFLFDSEFEAYDYVEKNGYPLIGREFKLAHRID